MLVTSAVSMLAHVVAGPSQPLAAPVLPLSALTRTRPSYTCSAPVTEPVGVPGFFTVDAQVRTCTATEAVPDGRTRLLARTEARLTASARVPANVPVQVVLVTTIRPPAGTTSQTRCDWAGRLQRGAWRTLRETCPVQLDAPAGAHQVSGHLEYASPIGLQGTVPAVLGQAPARVVDVATAPAPSPSTSPRMTPSVASSSPPTAPDASTAASSVATPSGTGTSTRASTLSAEATSAAPPVNPTSFAAPSAPASATGPIGTAGLRPWLFGSVLAGLGAGAAHRWYAAARRRRATWSPLS